MAIVPKGLIPMMLAGDGHALKGGADAVNGESVGLRPRWRVVDIEQQDQPATRPQNAPQLA